MTAASLDRDPAGTFPNRPYVLQEIGRQLKRYRRRRRPFSLVRVDIHNLDWFEDTFGRNAGSSVLGFAADFIRSRVREVDVWYLCARDAYIIIMDETDAEAARILAERLAAEAKKTMFAFGTDRVTLELSFTTATCPEDGTEASTLLRAVGLNPEAAGSVPVKIPRM